MGDVENIAVPETEPTPAMIRAGVEVYSPFDRRYDELDDLVERVWRAMSKARLEDPAAAHR